MSGNEGDGGVMAQRVMRLEARVAELEKIVRAAPDRHDYAEGVPAKRIQHEGAVS